MSQTSPPSTSEERSAASQAEELSVLVAKVERLWRKARSTNFPAEAEAYEQKALYLMARARISRAMLDLDGDADSIIDVKIGATLAGGYRIPAETIFSSVCRAFGCRPYLYVSGRQSQPAAVGFGSDIDRVKFLWPLLHTDSLRAATQLRGRTAAQTSALRRSAMYGYAEAIAERFEAINRIATDDADRGVDQSGAEGGLANDLDQSDRLARSATMVPTGSALVVKDREELVEERFRQLGVSQRARRVSGGYGGHEHGRAAGMAADLTGGERTMKRSPGALAR